MAIANATTPTSNTTHIYIPTNGQHDYFMFVQRTGYITTYWRHHILLYMYKTKCDFIFLMFKMCYVLSFHQSHCANEVIRREQISKNSIVKCRLCWEEDSLDASVGSKTAADEDGIAAEFKVVETASSFSKGLTHLKSSRWFL